MTSRSGVAAERSRRVYVTGVFDMDNFGDLLFPLIASFRLRDCGFDVVPVAPTSVRPGLLGALNPVDIAEMMSSPGQVDAILVGGGYIIHHQRMDFLKEYKAGDLGHWASMSLWLGATVAAALRDIPIAWNAPGVLHPFAGKQRSLMASALRAADYLSVRDRGSLELLSPPDDISVEVVPDTVADLARMWPLPSLEAHFRKLLERKGYAGGSAFVACHVRDRSASNHSHATIASWLDEFAGRHGLVPILIAIGRSHEDEVLARQLSRHLNVKHVLLDDPASLQEIAAAIGYSRLYVGASLHGYVASAAYGVPGVLVARPSYRKFGGFLEHTERRGDLARDWAEAFSAAPGRPAAPSIHRMPDKVFTALDRHWQRIQSAIADPRRKKDGRRQFLDAYLQRGLQTSGAGWLLQPFLPGARRTPGTPA